VTNGPYVSGKQSVAGYIIVLSASIEEALEIAKKCPILQGTNTSVEIREPATPQSMREANR
jgi:hypothetical protein